MMQRIQVLLDPELQQQARDRAGQLRVSFAEYLRGLIRRDLGQPRPTADPRVVFNLGRSSSSDVARNKDSMVGAAVSAERARPKR